MKKNSYLGIEFGSTRIKAVLIDEKGTPLASGDHAWENRYENDIWTYSLEDVWEGVQDAYRNLAKDVEAKYGEPLTQVGALGISAMMHGYLAFDRDGKLLVPFRTWRNTITGPAAAELTELLQFNMPQRWTVSHLHQAILNGEPHVKDIDFLTTLAGYVHWQLTGEKVLGVGDASGVFPIDSDAMDYDQAKLDLYERHIAAHGFPWKLRDILPRKAAGPHRHAAARLPGLPAGGRRRYRHDGHQRRGGPHRQCLRRHVHLHHGGPGEGPLPGL